MQLDEHQAVKLGTKGQARGVEQSDAEVGSVAAYAHHFQQGGRRVGNQLVAVAEVYISLRNGQAVAIADKTGYGFAGLSVVRQGAGGDAEQLKLETPVDFGVSRPFRQAGVCPVRGGFLDEPLLQQPFAIQIAVGRRFVARGQQHTDYREEKKQAFHDFKGF